MQLPQTYGPYNSIIARWIAGYLINNSSLVIARDRCSQSLARKIGRRHDVFLSPDVAFSLEAIHVDRVELSPSLASTSSGYLYGAHAVIGVNVNGLVFNGGYTRDNMFQLKLDYKAFLLKLVESLVAAHRGEVWLLPHTFGPAGCVESDNEASKKVWDAHYKPTFSHMCVCSRGDTTLKKSRA